MAPKADQVVAEVAPVADEQREQETQPVESVIDLVIESPDGTFKRVKSVRMNENVSSLRQLLVEDRDLCFHTSFTLQLAIVSKNGKKKAVSNGEVMSDFALLVSFPELLSGTAYVRMVPTPYTCAGVHEHVTQLRKVLHGPPVQYSGMEPITRADALDILAKIATAAAAAESVDATKPAADAEKAPATDEASKTEDKSASETKEIKKIPAFNADEVTDAPVPVPVSLAGFYASENQRKGTYKSFDDALKGIKYDECVKSVSFSQWNPPPRQCAMMGDLAFLEVHTLEGTKLQVTASPAGFFVNSTRNDQFNSNPSTTPYRSLTLVGLLQQASKQFKKRLAAMLTLVDTRAKAFAKQVGLNETDVLQMHNVTSAHTPVDRADMTQWNTHTPTVATDSNSTGKSSRKDAAKEPAKEPFDVSEWMTPKTAVAHTKNENRAEAFICDSLTMTLSVTLRDWNDEYQSICEMPVLGLDDRIARARALDSLGKEFKEAAVSGAMGVLSGRIPSLDAAETPESRVYLLNNIFFSLATLDEEEKTKSKDDKTPQVVLSATSSYSTWNHDLQSVKAMNRVLEQARRVRESNAADEANAATDATDASTLAALDAALMSSRTGLHTLATVVVDYLGRRVVAQAIIHGILQGDPSTSLLYGSMNKGQSIASAPKAHELMREVAPGLSLKESLVHPLGMDEQNEDGWVAVAETPEISPETKNQTTDSPAKCITSSSTTSSDPKSEVSLFGPVECKGVQGLDGRVYAIDLVRMMPFDMNYYMAVTSGSESKTEKVAVKVPTANSSTYVALLRPELLPLHARSALREVGESRQAFIREKLGEMLQGKVEASVMEKTKGETTPTSTDVVSKEGEDEEKPAATAPGSISAEQAQILSKEAMEAFPDPEPLQVDVNAFSEFPLVGTADEIKSNETDILSLCKFLLDSRIPEFVRDMSDSNVNVQDGETLCKAMHSAGINLRYLGKVCELVLDAELTTRRVVSRENSEAEPEESTIVIPPVARYLAEIFEIEMVGRAVKTLLRKLINQHSAIAQAPAAVFAALLNYLLGSDASLPLSAQELYPIKQQQTNRQNHVDGLGVLTEAMSSSLLCDGPQGLWKQIEEHVMSHFGYKLRMWTRSGSTTPAIPPTTTEEADNKLDSEEMHNYQKRAYPIPFLRRVCQLVGVRVSSRDYEMMAQSRYPFSPADVLNVVPVIKTSIPDWPLDEARQFLAAARAHVAAWSPQPLVRPSQIKQPSPSQAFQLANQSVNLVNQVNGICHRSAADGYQVIASVLEHVGEDAAAITQQLHALVLMDREGARDTPAVANAHAWLGRYYQRVGEVALAIDHIRRSIYLLDIVSGPSHSEAATMYKLLGELYVTVGTPKHLNLAVACIQEALRRCDYDRVQFGLCLSAMGQVFACGGDFREAIKYSQEASKLLEDALGAKDKRTKSAQECVKLFTTKAVQYQREMKNKQAGGGGVRVVHQQRVQVTETGVVDVTAEVVEPAVEQSDKVGGGAGKKKKSKNKNKKNKKK